MPEQSAATYEATLKHFYDSDAMTLERPLFDLTLLGIGDDGHTASLFPGQPALLETRKWAVAVIGAKAEPRITLTYPTLDSSRDVAFWQPETGNATWSRAREVEIARCLPPEFARLGVCTGLPIAPPRLQG
jgi:6-phosphogluconolactonase/glucosamine-6-phosphate isomerase/deaminase